jgi:GntR family histidine utilization transcriptional repressor
MNEAQPLYAQVKDHILGQIRSGAWTPGQRVPSENELVESFGISRMTANRALRELTAEGFVARVPGVGTFVRVPPARGSLMELRNIAEEIAARGHRHTSRIERREDVTASPQLAEDFELKGAQRLFHIVILHQENGVPVQIEDRYVNPFVVPGFMARDFAIETPTAYLVSAVPVDELEHTVEAIMPDAAQQRLLGIDDAEPCLALRRRSWSKGHVVTVATLVYPASRYALYSRYRTGPQGTIAHQEHAP